MKLTWTCYFLNQIHVSVALPKVAKSNQQDAIGMKGLLRKAIQQSSYTQGNITQDKLIWKN